jgi:hypothetical protein
MRAIHKPSAERHTQDIDCILEVVKCNPFFSSMPLEVCRILLQHIQIEYYPHANSTCGCKAAVMWWCCDVM